MDTTSSRTHMHAGYFLTQIGHTNLLILMPVASYGDPHLPSRFLMHFSKPGRKSLSCPLSLPVHPVATRRCFESFSATALGRNIATSTSCTITFASSQFKIRQAISICATTLYPIARPTTLAMTSYITWQSSDHSNACS